MSTHGYVLLFPLLLSFAISHNKKENQSAFAYEIPVMKLLSRNKTSTIAF